MRRIPPTLLLLASILTGAAPPARAQVGIGTCPMGQAGNSTGGVNGQYGPGLLVYQWFDPTACGFCFQAGGVIELRTVEIQAFVGEAAGGSKIPAIVSVVGWKGSPGCPEPDDAQVLMAPQNVIFQMPVVNTPRLFEIGVALAPTRQFTQPAFLRVEIPPTPANNFSAALGQIVAPTCTICRQYVSSPLLTGGTFVDACSGAGVYPYVMRVRGDCAVPTATERTSWGQLKSFYR